MSDHYPLEPTESDLERESLDAQELLSLGKDPDPDPNPRALVDDLYEALTGRERPAMPISPQRLWDSLLKDVAALAADNRRMHLLYEIIPPEKNAVALMDQAGRALLLFAKHAGPVDPEHGFATIESFEPWRAAGAFFDAAYGGQINAQEALR